MNDDMAQVVAQLRAVREQAAAAAVTAMRAHADAEKACHHYTEAAKGTNDNKIKQAIADIEVARDKIVKNRPTIGRSQGKHHPLPEQDRPRFGPRPRPVGERDAYGRTARLGGESAL